MNGKYCVLFHTSLWKEQITHVEFCGIRIRLRITEIPIDFLNLNWSGEQDAEFELKEVELDNYLTKI